MKYQITMQYARDEERGLAEFSDFNDANLFVEKKLFSDSMQKIKIIYRLFEDHKLVDEFNKKNIHMLIRKAQYADGDCDLPDSFLNQFKVINRSMPDKSFATFNNLNDARIFVEGKLVSDSAINSNVIYQIFDSNILLEEWNQAMIDVLKKQTEEPQGKVKKISFRPTPLNTTPRPPGSPQAWVIDEDDERYDKDK